MTIEQKAIIPKLPCAIQDPKKKFYWFEITLLPLSMQIPLIIQNRVIFPAGTHTELANGHEIKLVPDKI